VVDGSCFPLGRQFSRPGIEKFDKNLMTICGFTGKCQFFRA